MPAVTDIERAKIGLLRASVSPSVATLFRYHKSTRKYVDFGIGCVVYADSTKTVIVTNFLAYDEEKEAVGVYMGNGICRMATEFVTNGNSSLTSLLVKNAPNFKAVTFSETPVERGQLIFTLGRAWEEIKTPGLYTGSVILPRCTSVNNRTKNHVSKYDNYFAVSCPVSGPIPVLGIPANLERIVGAPVFNMDGEALGLIERCSNSSYDIKFARCSASVVAELQTLFRSTDWKGALVRELKRET
uniref:Uncharacterized protein n=1 Tax=Arundo donax TaxID=35708 RepID=A0A0A9U6G4_ARUDO